MRWRSSFTATTQIDGAALDSRRRGDVGLSACSPPGEPSGAADLVRVIGPGSRGSRGAGEPGSRGACHVSSLIQLRSETFGAHQFGRAAQVADLWVPNILVALCDLDIFVDQAAEPVPPQDPDILAHSGRRLTPGGRPWHSVRCGR